MTSMSETKSSIKERYLSSVVFLVPKRSCTLIENSLRTMNQKLGNLSHCQDRPLREIDHAVKTLHRIDLPIFVNEILSFAQKHTNNKKFNKTYLLTDLDKLLRSKQENGFCTGKICKVEASAKWFAEKEKETPADRRLSTVTKFFNKNEFIALTFGKRNRICATKKTKNQSQLIKMLDCFQFLKTETTIEEIFLKNENDNNGLLLEIKENTPMFPVFSVPGNSYHISHNLDSTFGKGA